MGNPSVSNQESGPFSAGGYSGAVMVDSLGRVGGIITAGIGGRNQRTEGDPDPNLDMTYANPIDFLVERMQANGLNIDPDKLVQPPLFTVIDFLIIIILVFITWLAKFPCFALLATFLDPYIPFFQHRSLIRTSHLVQQ
jgi:hypothetical protein